MVLAGITMFSVLASGQPRQQSATMDDLLREVQGLRADLKAASTASLRVQALVARAGLQEERLKALSLQLNEVNTQLEEVTRDRSTRELQLADLGASIANDSIPGQLTGQDVEVELAALKVEVSRLHGREAEIRNRANQLSELVSTEHARWEEFNRRLDELDHKLEVPEGISPR
jgi:chromosome segregation ATPase